MSSQHVGTEWDRVGSDAHENGRIQDRLLALSETLGRKWHPIILYCLFEDEPMRFTEFRETIDGISAKVLSENLEHLIEEGYVERRVTQQQPRRVEYTLTSRGTTLKPVLATALDSAIGTRQAQDIGG